MTALTEDLLATSKANRNLLVHLVRGEVERSVARLGLVSAHELDAAARAGQGPGAAGRRARGRPAQVVHRPQGAVTRAKKTAKKTAKKSTAKKTTAKKSTKDREEVDREEVDREEVDREEPAKRTTDRRSAAPTAATTSTGTTTSRPTYQHEDEVHQRRQPATGRRHPSRSRTSRRPAPTPGSRRRWPALDGLGDQPPAEHVEVYEEVHRVLQESLADGDPRHRQHARRAPERRAAVTRRARLDAELVRRGLARSREQAAELVAAGRVRVRRPDARQAGHPGRAGATRSWSPSRRRRPSYVSRGGHKLAGALDAFAPDGLAGRGPPGLDAGRVDRRLHRRAAARAAPRRSSRVDVGYGQLAWSLQHRRRGCTVLDRTNVRDLTPTRSADPVDLVVADLSFISLRLVLPALVAVRGAGRATWC